MEPTRFADLNGLLAEFVASHRTLLGETLCGIYLVGSFAAGDADEFSDVDFMVATHGELSGEQIAALGDLHRLLFALPVPWAEHLEGSYASTERLRRIDAGRGPFLYLDNGTSELAWDDHCNTQVVRWTLREHGVALAGPEPATLVDPVPGDDLRAGMPTVVDKWVEYLGQTRAGGMSRWLQPYAVLAFCRILHTLEFGEVASKRRAGEWALGALDPEWTELVQTALDQRADPWERVQLPADPALTERTRAFVAYAVRVARA